jgi:hypothetical protein
MNHKHMTSAIVAIVAALALTGVTFAIPQQVLAYRHHNNHNSNSIRVDQQISQGMSVQVHLQPILVQMIQVLIMHSMKKLHQHQQSA